MADFTQWKDLLNLLHDQATGSDPDRTEKWLNHIASVSAAVLDGLRPVLAAATSSGSAVMLDEGASSQQQQLYSFLFSTMKMVKAGAFGEVDYEDAQHADDWCVAVADTAAAMLGSNSSSNAKSEQQPTDSLSMHGTALSMLPWLGLFGRCCLRWHLALQKNEMGAWFIPQGGLDIAMAVTAQLGKPAVSPTGSY